jgi:hypothetical protein
VNRVVLVPLLAALAASLPLAPLIAQDTPEVSGLALAPMAGQRVPVLPVTVLLAQAPADEMVPGGREARLRWADSLVGEALLDHGPEVNWVFPPELRRVALRSPGVVTDPDRMGQALLRAPLKQVPDPLRAYLRSLAAMTDARLVLVPAAIRLDADSSGAIRAETVLVLADTRNGAILWRSQPTGLGRTAAEALTASIVRILPHYD